MFNSLKQPKALSCHLCGEKLTQPHFYKGNIYGWSCIKKVNPAAKKSKLKANWQPCNLIDSIALDYGNIKLIAEYNGKKYVSFRSVNSFLGCAIIENNGSYFIDLSKYKK